MERPSPWLRKVVRDNALRMAKGFVSGRHNVKPERRLGVRHEGPDLPQHSPWVSFYIWVLTDETFFQAGLQLLMAGQYEDSGPN